MRDAFWLFITARTIKTEIPRWRDLHCGISSWVNRKSIGKEAKGLSRLIQKEFIIRGVEMIIYTYNGLENAGVAQERYAINISLPLSLHSTAKSPNFKCYPHVVA